MSELFEILEKIHEKPGMYIGKASVNDLFMFLVGYKTARRELGIESTEKENDFYGEFQPWLQERYRMSISASWAKMIEFCTGSDERGFYRFFELLDEFWQRHEEIEGDRAIANLSETETEPIKVG
jgi:hypothetical protein